MSKLLTLLILVNCLSSCRTSSPDTTLVLNQCTITFERGNEQARCDCRKYKVSPEFIGPLENFKLVDIKQCDLLIGYRPVEYTKLTNLMEYVRIEISNDPDNKPLIYQK